MAKQFMPDVPTEQRLQLLKDNCDSMEETKYFRDLTAEQLDIKRETFVDNSIKLSQLEDELAAYKESYKQQMKPLKDENKGLQTQIKLRKEQFDGVLFHIADHENGIMETFDENGDFVSSRRLKPNEKQAKLFVAGKTGTNQ